MPDGSNIIYRYDGSFQGFLCCVEASFRRKELPIAILSPEAVQETLFSYQEIETRRDIAERVWRSMREKMGMDAASLLWTAFLNGAPGGPEGEKEAALLRFAVLGYRYGPPVCLMHGREEVARIEALSLASTHEAHQLTGFLRFSEIQGGLAAVIEPKHFVLPLMREHFCGRYPEERFFIYDKTHHAALVYRPYESKILPVEDWEAPSSSELEEAYGLLWKKYYHAIGVEARENPQCRMSHMQKRFWTHLPELQPVTQREKDLSLRYAGLLAENIQKGNQKDEKEGPNDHFLEDAASGESEGGGPGRGGAVSG